jgi:hypothetical protein
MSIFQVSLLIQVCSFVILGSTHSKWRLHLNGFITLSKWDERVSVFILGEPAASALPLTFSSGQAKAV